MRKNNRELFFISILILLTIIAWIIVDVQHIQTNKKYVIDYQKSINMKINPLNIDLIKKLEKR